MIVIGLFKSPDKNLDYNAHSCRGITDEIIKELQDQQGYYLKQLKSFSVDFTG